MSNTFRPMLAGKFPGEDHLIFPLIVQPKYDGIRASVVNGKLVTRTLKAVPNEYIRSILEAPQFEGLDGELIVGSPLDKDCYRTTVSGVMSSDGEPDFSYYVFDLWNHAGTFTERHAELSRRVIGLNHPCLDLVPTNRISDLDTLNDFEARLVDAGYEGAILRGPDTRYKFGRGSKTAGDLLKLKRFVDFEADVIGVYEELHNGNEATTNALGRTERSSHKDNKTGKGTLGGLVCRREDGSEFKCGTGFDAHQRAELWAMYLKDATTVVGKIAKVKSFPIGEHEKPRHPVFLGFRDPLDIS